MFTDVIDDASGENLSSSNNQSCFGQQEDDIKTSEPVADEIGEFVWLESEALSFLIYLEAVVNQSKSTVLDILDAVDNTTSSNLNSVDQHTTTIRSSSIIEVNSINTSRVVQPCAVSLTSMIII